MKFLRSCNSRLWIYPICTVFCYLFFLSIVGISESIPIKGETFKRVISLISCRILVITSSLFPAIGFAEVVFHITKLKIINSFLLFIANVLLFGVFIFFGGFILIAYALAPLDALKTTPDILFKPVLISILVFIIYLVVRILWIIKK